jgi:hypothetical protein
MKQITINGTANALQVAAVIFLLGNSFVTPENKSARTPVNKAIDNGKQNGERKSSPNTAGITTSYFHKAANEASNQPFYLHNAISATAFSIIKPFPASLPASPKKNETVKK